jgi:hypothetical protein
MADTGKHQETALPDLASLPLSQLDAIRPEALRKAVRDLRERLEKEQDPINSFNATI